jgi:hypothetical protein
MKHLIGVMMTNLMGDRLINHLHIVVIDLLGSHLPYSLWSTT